MDSKQIIAKVRDLAREYPSAIYRGYTRDGGLRACAYGSGEVQDGPSGEGCIFGHALRLLDIEVPPHLDDESIEAVLDHLSILHTYKESEWMQEDQYRQDSRHSWSYAVQEADAIRPILS